LPYGVKTEILPWGDDELLIRVENLGSTFDGDAASKNAQYDLIGEAQKIWEAASGPADVEIAVTEKNILGNMDFSEMENRKINWNGSS